MSAIRGFNGQWRFLSNFYDSGELIVVPWGRYPTAEHAYQAAKTLSDTEREMIARCTFAGTAKRLSRTFQHLDPDWDQKREAVMLEVLRAKFRPGSMVATQLIGTRPSLIVEENTWGDRFWGKVNGEGLNRLGELLMQVREEMAA